MHRFKIFLQSQPEQFYRKAGNKTVGSLQKCFQLLEDNPFYLPGRIKKLQGYEGMFRYRLGDLRVVYQVSVEKKTIDVIAILPRGDVYKKI